MTMNFEPLPILFLHVMQKFCGLFGRPEIKTESPVLGESIDDFWRRVRRLDSSSNVVDRVFIQQVRSALL